METAHRTGTAAAARSALRRHNGVPETSGGSIEGDGAIDPRKRDREISLNGSENKSSGRKLSLIPFVSSAYYVE